MNWTAIAAISTAVAALASCGVLLKVSFIAGRVVEKVDGLDRRVGLLERLVPSRG